MSLPAPGSRLLPWLKVGEAALALFNHRNVGSRFSVPTPPSKIPGCKAKETLTARLKALKKSLQDIEHAPFLLFGLECNPAQFAEAQNQDRNPDHDLVLIMISSLAWLRLSGCSSDTRPSILSSILICAQDCPVPEALLIARHILDSAESKKLIGLSENCLVFSMVVAKYLAEDRIGILRPLTGQSNPGGNQTTNPVTSVKRVVEQLLPLNPKTLEHMVLSTGYISQERARRSICIAATRHIRRLKAIYLEGKSITDLPKRSCVLMLGPTGCGKTHLLETVFGNILKLPVAIFDAGQITESSYIGAKLDHVLGRLVQAAGGNIALAQCGVLCLDEIDKIAACGADAGMTPGESLGRDAAGGGAQKTLLKLLEGSVLTLVPTAKYSDPWHFDSRNTLIVAAGAFTALRHRRHAAAPIGFNGVALQSIGKPAAISGDDLIRYGMQPEFIGRFTHQVHFNDLSVADLRAILVRNVIPQYSAELAMDGIGFEVEDEVLDHLAQEAAAKRSGARGIQTCLTSVMQDCLFDALSTSHVRAVHLVLEDGGVGYDIRKTPLPKDKSSSVQDSANLPILGAAQ